MNTDSAAAVRPFHLAFPVHDLDAARNFYGGLLGCAEGRSDPHWIDFSLYGHQIVAHLDENFEPWPLANPVDGEQVLADRLTAAAIAFVIAPTVRFPGQVGEQATMFFQDPSGNALEFKAFASDDQLFAKD